MRRLVVDKCRVTRAISSVVVLVSLAIVGWLFALQSKNQGPSSQAVTQAEAHATLSVAAVNFSQIGASLQAAYAQAGTYVGAQLPAGSGVSLAQASTTSYCLETTVNGTLVHEAGPGGSPAAGAC